MTSLMAPTHHGDIIDWRPTQRRARRAPRSRARGGAGRGGRRSRDDRGERARGAAADTRRVAARRSRADESAHLHVRAREVVERAARQTSACAARARGIRGSGQEKVRAGVVCGVGEETERTQRRGRRGGRLGKRCHYGGRRRRDDRHVSGISGRGAPWPASQAGGEVEGFSAEAPSHSVLILGTRHPTTFRLSGKKPFSRQLGMTVA